MLREIMLYYDFLFSVVKTTVLLKDINDFAAVNEIYATCKYCLYLFPSLCLLMVQARCPVHTLQLLVTLSRTVENRSNVVIDIYI